MTSFTIRSVALASAGLVALLTAPAHAQDDGRAAAAPPDAGAAQGDIIVTAERREQRLQDVASTVQAFTGEDLDRLGVNADFQNLQVVVPGLQISQNEGGNEIFIRGIGNQDSEQFTSDSATAVHLNGVFLPRTRGIGPMLFDLERVEVNKGPQGTLRGRNATAGTINIISRKPEFDGIGGYLQAGAGNYDARGFEGALNLPLADSFALRGAVFYRDHDDYFSNGLDNDVPGAGAERELAYRLSARWEPSERFSALLIYDGSESRGTGFPGNFFGQAYSEGFTVESLGSDARNQNFLTQGRVTNDIQGVTLIASYDFGPAILEYTGGYRANQFFNRNPRRPFQNGAVIPSNTDPSVSVGAGFAFDPDNFGTLYIGEDSRAQIHELRLYAPNSARLRWTLGAFYLDEDFAGYRFDTSDKSATQNSLGGETRSTDVSVEALSFFGDATFDVTEALRVKGGLRWTRDRKSNTGYQVQYAFNFPGIAANDIRFSTPGYRPVGPRDRRFADPFSTDAASFFLDGVARFGSRDTLDDLIAANPGGVSLTTSPGGLFTREFGEDYVDYRIGAEYDLAPDHLLYATLATGSRSGGINPILVRTDGTLSPSNFSREKLTSYELGSKNEFDLGGTRLRANLSAFWYQYRDQVLNTAVAADGSVIAPGEPFSANVAIQNVNVARSRILGFEFDTGARLGGGFDVNAIVTYLDSEYQEASITDGRQSLPGGQLSPNVDISGNPLVNVSRWNVLGNVGQTLDAGFGSVDWRLTGSYRSGFRASPFGGRGLDAQGNEIPLADMPTLFGQPGIFFRDKVEEVFLLNVNVGANFGPDERYRFELFGSNLTNETYSQKQIINFFVNITFVNIPRVYGARLSAKF